MQLTGRSAPSSARALIADADQWNRGLCGRQHDGLQLICIPLGSNTDHRDLGGTTRHTLLLLGLLLPLPIRSAEAQLRISPTAAQLRATAELRSSRGTVRTDGPSRFTYSEAPTRDYRWEGLAIGAGALGLAGALLMHGTCEADEACTGPTVGGFALGAVIGGVTGGLIGGLIAKGE